MAEYETHVFSNLQENIQKIVLENITSVTLNTEVLKVNFEAIVSILKGLVKRMDQNQDGANQTEKYIKDLRFRLDKLEDKQSSDKIELDDKISNNQQHIKTLQEETNHNKQEIRDLQDSISELKKNQTNLNTIYEKDLSNIKQKIEQHDSQIQELLNKINGESNKNNSDGLDNSIAEIQKLLEDFVRKDEYNTYKKQTDNNLQNHQTSIDDLFAQLKDLRNLVSDKLSCEIFDEHLTDYNNIKNIVIGLANNGDQKHVIQSIVQSGPSLSTKDASLLKELGQKFPELENLVKKMQKDLNDHLLSYKSFTDDTTKKIQNNEENLKNFKIEIHKRIAELEASFNSLRDQLFSFNNSSSGKVSGESSVDLKKLQIALTSLTERVTNVEERLNNHQEILNDHKNKINGIEEELIDLKALKVRIEMLEHLLKERDSKDQGHKIKGSKGSSFENGGGVTLEQVKQIVDEEIKNLRDEILAILEELKALIDKKADTEDLMKSEAALLEKLDQIAGALMKRAQADKNDTKKALMFLEKKINEISLIVLGGPNNSEEGAIFAKKPWTPWSCASCDSKLKDYPGPLIDHKNWNKLPQRETSPGRMTQGKFGKGWSKWVDNKRMTVEKSRDPFSSPSQKLGEALPEIQRDGRNQVDSSRLNE